MAKQFNRYDRDIDIVEEIEFNARDVEIPRSESRHRRLVCLEKIGPILKRALRGLRVGEMYGTSAIYAGADNREAA